MFKKDFQEKIDKLPKIEIVEINDKVARDFIKFMVSSEDLNISPELFIKMVECTKIVASYNNHKFIRQSDLFAILELEQDEIYNLEEIFEKAIQTTMFKELNIYLQANIAFKDQLSNALESNIISDQQIEDSKKLYKWTSDKIWELENSIDTVLNGEQLRNILTENQVAQIYKKTVSELITMMKWHLIGFQIAANFKKK